VGLSAKIDACSHGDGHRQRSCLREVGS
jgi:hypothetical protein